MPSHQDALSSLFEAVRLSPENVPLRKHLASLLMDAGRFAEAEQQYTEALNFQPDDVQIKLGLAHAFIKGKKASAAFVLLEELMALEPPVPLAFLLHARLSYQQKDIEQAIESYETALELDYQLADAAFEIELQKHIRPTSGEHDQIPVPVEYPEDEIYTDIERPAIDFSDVGGMEDIKEEIRLKIIHPMQHPELYEAYGKTIGGGVLLYGPPGCGKTLLARATAGQVQAGFLAVGISDILDMWMGNSEKNLHRIFEMARDEAPCVLFFDEVDALGASRADMKRSGGRHLINQFLAELDGVQYDNEGLLILAATNTPWNMDAAFRRPGRFDRILFVPPPDEAARAAILRIHLKDKPVGEVNLAKVAKKTKGFTGADLKAVVDMAIESKLQDAIRAGKPLPIEQKDLLRAAGRVIPSAKEWFATARNYALYANESGLYDDVLAYLNIKK